MEVSASIDLSSEQKERLQCLWKAHARDLIGIKTAAERKPVVIPAHTCLFIARLHSFFAQFLSKAAADDDDVEKNSEESDFLNDSQSSCLKEYAKLALESTSSQQRKMSRIRLKEGRHVIALHHEEFLTELARFELKGQPANAEFIRKESFGAFLYHMPGDALASLGCSMALAMATMATSSDASTPAHPLRLARFLDATQFCVRFVHVQPQVQMMDVKTGLVGKFLTIKGHVVKARPKRLRVATADFSCPKCGSIFTHGLDQGRFSLPTSCPTEKCKSRTFTLLRPTARYFNVQDLRLQEAQEESTIYAGRTPRQLEIELTHDLVDICRPGDIVLVACTVAAINTAVASGQTGKRALETSTYKLYLKGHSVTTMSESCRPSQHKSGSRSIVYTQQQLQSIVQLCHADHRYFGLIERRAFPFDLLVRSICPAIIGHNEVKAGILLCLLGGTPPLAATSSSSQSMEKSNSIRYNSHMLIVGE
jgi:DNA replicative helicase MCM subunit Mcm2 (Cdc46/Mcm family)